MKTFSRKNTMAAVVLAAASVGLPTTTLADPANSGYRYEECKRQDTESQIIGGLVGAVAGGLLGSEIAGRGDGTEGAAVGAALGAAAGIAITDSECDERGRRRVYSSNTRYPSSNAYGTRTYQTSHRSHSGSRNHGYSHRSGGYYGGSNNYGYGNSNNRYYGSNGGYYGGNNGYYGNNNGYYGGSRGYNRGHGYGNINSSRWGYNASSHVCGATETRLQHIDWQMKELRRERDYLERKRKYSGYDRQIDQRMWQIGEELARLKYEEKSLKRNKRHSNHYYYDYDD
ncbi:MAG: glycine zipper 2TM domain-containing protein [Hellea sp.]|nr:glycine zipper 2TM domain-containing protein [Hellea sp.]